MASGIWNVCQKSPPTLNENILKTWLPLVDEKKAVMVLKVTKDTQFVQGMLELSRSDIDTSQVVRALGNAFEGLDYVVTVPGAADNGEWTWYRAVFNTLTFTPRPNDVYCFMADIRASDYGVRKLELELGVCRKENSAGMYGRVAGRPFFYNDYKGITGKELEAAFKIAASHLSEQVQIAETALKLSEQQTVDAAKIKQLIQQLPRDRETAKGFMLKVVGEFEVQMPTTMLAVADIIAAVARDAEKPQHRLTHEAFSGYLAGFTPGFVE